MKEKCRPLKQTCIRTAIVIFALLIIGFIYSQPSFTTEQTFRRMETYHGVEHSQVVYTNRGIHDTIWPTNNIDYIMYHKEDVYLGQRGDLYSFAAIEKKLIHTNNGATNTFITFQLQEGKTLATTWNLADMVPPRNLYPTNGVSHYIAGVVTDPSAAKVEAEIWCDENALAWTSVTAEDMNASYGSGPPWRKTVETTEFYHGMFLIYTGFEFWWSTAEEILDYGYTITVYDADGNIIAQHDQPMDYKQAYGGSSPASGILDQTLSIDGNITTVALENTNDYDVELCADYQLYYANLNDIPAAQHSLNTDESWITIPAGQTQEFTFDYIENKPINLFTDEEYYNTVTCVIRPAGETHGGEYRISISKNT